MNTKIYTSEQIIQAIEIVRERSEQLISEYEDGKNPAFNSGVYSAEMDILKHCLEDGTLDVYF